MIGVSSSNDVLPLFIITKGKKTPQDVNHLENDDFVITATSNASMDQTSMLLWIEKVWKRYSNRFDRALLILDKFRVHETEEILKKFEECKSDIVFIPTGLTYLCQPCDVYLHKPLKEKIRNCWQGFMANQATKDTNFFPFYLRSF